MKNTATINSVSNSKSSRTAIINLRLLAIAAILSIASAVPSHAALSFYSPIGVSASNELAGDLLADNLFDAVITESSIGQSPTGISGSSTTNFGNSWAINANFYNEGVLVLDHGSSVTLDGFVYAQRTFGGTFIDDFQSVDIWIRNTDPGTASTSLPPTLGTPDATFALVTNDLTLRRYDFSDSLTGRYVILRFSGVDNDPSRGHPGGQELRFFAVPEPGSVCLVSLLGGLSILRRHRHRDL